ncbi:hypothetical protein NQ317_009842 [Molorchus minor]|uniref:Uncharacterized protein n=1 Tax=Molorchus minor TaxID=1323400 RepID=A0ABQ9K1W5_9CUCU|nr:hypothetical protein NQ317_009842 [Molorchus minor]
MDKKTASWDVGVGAMDDGGGFFHLLVFPSGIKQPRSETQENCQVRNLICNKIYRVLLAVLKNVFFLRAVLWTNEENGMAGVNTYNSVHQDELDDFVFIMESDEGTFTPLGLEFVAGSRGTCILTEIMKNTGVEVKADKDMSPRLSVDNKPLD